MPEFRRLTYKTPDGAWGIEGVSLLSCPARLYGAAKKLCDMENLCEDVYRAKDAELTLDALQELVDKGLGGRFLDLRIYDQPRELTEFRRAYPNDLYCEACAMYSNNNGICNNGALPLRRPPQSWCYVEGMKDE